MSRMIDADALIERMREQAGCRACESYDGVRCRACTWEDATNLADEAPTIDTKNVDMPEEDEKMQTLTKLLAVIGALTVGALLGCVLVFLISDIRDWIARLKYKHMIAHRFDNEAGPNNDYKR